MIRRLEEWRLLGVPSPSSSIHLRLTGPRADGRRVIGLKLLLVTKKEHLFNHIGNYVRQWKKEIDRGIYSGQPVI